MIPQRVLNRQYNFNLHQMPFLADLKMTDLSQLIRVTAQLCPHCQTSHKSHYCVEPNCRTHELLCWKCDCSHVNSPHFMHEFTYAMPLFCQNIFENFESIRENLRQFDSLLRQEISKMKDYLLRLEGILTITEAHRHKLDSEYKQSNFDEFKSRVAAFSKELALTRKYPHKLKDLLHEVKFYSAEECKAKQDKIYDELKRQIEQLKWPNNPQKDLQDLLNGSEREEKKDLFLGSKKKVEFSQIDHCFKVNNQFYTENLKTHRVELKVQSDFLNKTKFYEALIYHLKDVEMLNIQNAHMNQIRTPLTFRGLRSIQFNCNTQSEPLTLRIDSVTDKLKSLKIRKLREEELKNLKCIIQNSSNLMEVHIEIYNKLDLSYNKDLCDCIAACKGLPNLRSFHLRVRTESEVKRVYGYLSKFFKDSPVGQEPPNTLSSCMLVLAILDMLKKCQGLTHVLIEGVKGLENLQVLESIESMENLTGYRIQYDNIDLTAEANEERNRKLLTICQTRKKAVQALYKNSKFKHFPKPVMMSLVENFLL